MSWIVARTEPLREQTARRFLELAGFSVYVPYIHERYSKGGRRSKRLRPLFPSYAFVALQNGRWWDARWCVGVAGVIMSGGEPARLGDHIVDEIRSRERGGAVQLPRRPGLKLGDQVRVVGGVFRDHFGVYAGMKPRQRVEILLQLLGGQQKVMLAQQDIEAVR